jgi:ketosteroid isomerase-like protein
MNRSLQRFLQSSATLVICLAFAPNCRPQTANTPNFSQDTAYVQAINSKDKNAADALLDADFNWTDRSGKAWNRDVVLQNLSRLTALDNAKTHDYHNLVYLTGAGRVASDQNSSEKIRFVRVWAHQPSGWKLLIEQDTVIFGTAPTAQATVPAGTACDNPCKHVPYQAPSPEAQAVVDSWAALEDAVNHRDADGWASHVADEFVFNVKEDGNPLTKADRVAIIKKQSQGTTVTDIGTVVPGTMKVWLLGDSALMTDQQQPTTGGNPYQAMRVWVKRDGRWQLVYSQQTVISPSTLANN